MSKPGIAELEGGRRFGECSSKKTMGSRFPVLLPQNRALLLRFPVLLPQNRALLLRNPVLLAWSSVVSPIGIAISPVLPPVGNHRNRSSRFVESQQKSPYANGGMSLGGNRIIADNRYLWSMGVRIPTAILVKAGRF